MTKNTSIPIKTPSSRNLFLVLLLLCLGAAMRCAYLWANTIVTKRLIVAEQKKVAEEQQQIAAFSALA
ncbi:MAG: hypothetical protein LBD75_02150 [Candidatus Peribacteria bacterium]|jgi:hypothetical protein|nr:hypothetical protein [Candidatus Peribacteria bacterium]